MDEKTEKLLKGDSRKKNSPKIKIFIGLAVIAVIAVICVGFFFYKNYKDSQYEKSLKLGQSYLENGDYENAILEFNKTIELDSKQLEPYNLLAQTATLTGDYELAHKSYDTLIELSEDKIAPTISKAEVYVAEEDYEKAEELLNSLKDEYPDSTLVDYALNSYLDGNSMNNIINQSEMTYDYNGNIYFATNLRNEDINEVQEIYRIYAYNVNEKSDPKLLLEEKGDHTISGQLNLSLWNGRLYYNLGQSIRSVNLYGSDQKTVTTDNTFTYLYEGSFYTEDNSSGKILFKKMSLDGEVEDVYDTRLLDSTSNLHRWLIDDGHIYYFILNNHTNQLTILDYNLQTDENSTIMNLPLQTTDLKSIVFENCYFNNKVIYFYYYDQIKDKTFSYSFSLEDKDYKPLDLSGTDETVFGFNVNDLNYFIGSNYSQYLSVYDKETGDLHKEIDKASFEKDTGEVFLSTSMIVRGVGLTPYSAFYKIKIVESDNSNYRYYDNCYMIDFDTWEGRLILSNQ